MRDASIMQIGEIDGFLDDDVIQHGKKFTFIQKNYEYTRPLTKRYDHFTKKFNTFQ